LAAPVTSVQSNVMSVPGATRESTGGESWLGAASGVADTGLTASVAGRPTPASVAVSVTLVALVTAVVVAVKPALVAPAAIVTLAGTDATPGRLLASDATTPPAGAALVNVTVPAEELPPVTLAGLTLTAESDAGGGTGVSVSVGERVTPRSEEHT